MKPLEKTKTYLVTGCSGFIGFHLCHMLLSNDCNVVGIDNLNEYYDINLKKARLKQIQEFKQFIFYKEDIVNKEAVTSIFKNHQPDIVINLAAQAGVRYSVENPDAYIQSNIVGFANILEACRHNPVEHLVYASSSSVYGANRKVPFSESDSVDHPVSLYAATKKSNELMAYTYGHLYGIPTTGLRFFTVYGPWGRPDMAYYSFTEAILKGKPIKVFNNGDLYRDFTYIDDIIEGICRVISNSPRVNEDGVRYKLYNIGNNKPVKLMDFIETLEDCIGKRAIKEYYPMQEGDVYRTYADISEIEEDFGFRPQTDIKGGLDKYIAWRNSYEL